MPRWRERRERRRRNAGRAGDGPGLPRAPCTHRRASAGRCVRRRVLCSSSAPLGDSKGAWSPPPTSARLPAARLAFRVSGVAVFSVPRCPAALAPSCFTGGGPRRPRTLPRRFRVHECPLLGAWSAHLGRRRSLANLRRFSFGETLKSFRERPQVCMARAAAGLGSRHGARSGVASLETGRLAPGPK